VSLRKAENRVLIGWMGGLEDRKKNLTKVGNSQKMCAINNSSFYRDL
jgi:hypothetical protein